MDVDAMNELMYDNLIRYFKTLAHTGYKSYDVVFKMLVMDFIYEITHTELRYYITNGDIKLMRDLLYQFFGSTCEVSLPTNRPYCVCVCWDGGSSTPPPVIVPTTTTTTTTTTSAAPVTSTTSAVPAERVIIKYPGDANDDNTVDVADAVMILQCISNKDVYGVDGSNIEFRITEQGMINADVTGNNDGVTAGRAVRSDVLR